MKLRIGEVIANLAATQSGMKAGQIAGEQERRRRQLQTFEQEEAYDRQIAGLLTKFDQASQGNVIEFLTRRAANRAAGRPSAFGLAALAQPPQGATNPFAQTPSMPLPSDAPTPTTATAGGAITRPSAPPSALLGGADAVALDAPGMMPQQPARPMLRPRLGAPAPATITQPPPGMGVRPQMPQALAPTLTRPEPPTTVIGQRQAPVAPAAAPVLPPDPPEAPKTRRRRVFIEGLGDVFLKGVTDADAKAMRTAVEARAKFLSQIPDLDPAIRQQLATTLGVLPSSFDDEDDYQSGQAFLRATTAFIPGGSLAAERVEDTRQQRSEKAYENLFKSVSTGSASVAASRLPALLKRERSLIQQHGETSNVVPTLEAHRADIGEIERLQKAGDVAGAEALAGRIQIRLANKVSPAQEAARETRLRKMIDSWPLEKANRPGDVRAAYQKAGLGYMVADLSDEALRFGSARAERRWSDLLGKMQAWKSGDPPPMAVVKATVGEMISLSRFMGREAAVPRDVLAQMDQATRARVKRIKDEEERKQRAEQFRTDQAAYRKQRDKIADQQRAQTQATKVAEKTAKEAERAGKVTGDERTNFNRYLEVWRARRWDKDAEEWVFVHPQQRRQAAFEAMKPAARKIGFDARPWGGPNFNSAPKPQRQPGGPPLLPAYGGEPLPPPRRTGRPGAGSTATRGAVATAPPPPPRRTVAAPAAAPPAPAKKTAPQPKRKSFDEMNPAELRAWFRRRQGG